MNIISKTNKATESQFIDFAEENKMNYNATTNGVTITVWPEFISNQSGPLGELFIWAYHIRIENFSAQNLKLINRYWKIIDENGFTQEVEGEGVVGLQPQILPQNSFKYSSGVHLSQPSGIMKGYFEMQKDDGTKFQAQIPAFSLDSPAISKSVN